MIKKYNLKIKNIPIYLDEYMEDGKIIKGRKQGCDNHDYIIVNGKTADLIYSTYKISLRKDKLKRILKNGS